MTLENLTTSGFEAEILGKKRKFKYEIRNFIALKKRFGVEVYDMIAKVLEGDLEAIIQMIWCGTLEFNEFDVSNPADIKEEIDIKKLFEMDYKKLRVVGFQICKGLVDSLPKGDTKKKTMTGEVKKTLQKIKAILKIK